MNRTIRYENKVLPLTGRDLKTDESPAPDFRAVTTGLDEFKLSDHKGKVKMITSVISLEKPLCFMQINEFNRIAQEYKGKALITGISNDLPFTLKRMQESQKLEDIELISDYKDHSYGLNYGLQIKGNNLLAPSVTILDKNDIIRYRDIAEDSEPAPNLTSAFQAFEEVLKNPYTPSQDNQTSRCIPCAKETPPLTPEEIKELQPKEWNWEVIENSKLHQTFKFKTFDESCLFVDIISAIAKEQDHHPDICIYYNKVKLTLTTHSVGGLSKNDFIMARLIDETNFNKS